MGRKAQVLLIHVIVFDVFQKKIAITHTHTHTHTHIYIHIDIDIDIYEFCGAYLCFIFFYVMFLYI
jgi:hypothetical protein